MVHHLGATGADSDDLSEVSSLFEEAVHLLALAFDSVVVIEKAGLGDVPSMDNDMIVGCMAVSTITGSKTFIGTSVSVADDVSVFSIVTCLWSSRITILDF